MRGQGSPILIQKGETCFLPLQLTCFPLLPALCFMDNRIKGSKLLMAAGWSWCPSPPPPVDTHLPESWSIHPLMMRSPPGIRADFAESRVWKGGKGISSGTACFSDLFLSSVCRLPHSLPGPAQQKSLSVFPLGMAESDLEGRAGSIWETCVADPSPPLSQCVTFSKTQDSLRGFLRLSRAPCQL